MLKKIGTLFAVLVIALGVAWSLLGLQLTYTQAESACEKTCNKDDEESEYLKCIGEKRSCLEGKISELQSKKVTLNSTIQLLNGRISIQELQIRSTEVELQRLEREVTELTDRIQGLDVSLDQLSEVLLERIQRQYKALRESHVTPAIASDTMSEVVFRAEYVEQTGQRTADAMARAEEQRLHYDEQKILKEQKQEEVQQKQLQLEKEQGVLSNQRSEQQFLLTETQSNEQKFQAELAKTLAEVQAIQSIIAGRGSESSGGKVKEGARIASVIQGASTCSTGTHLHFEVVKDKLNLNPAGYLKPTSIQWNNSPDGSFGFGGDWEWPLIDPVRITQGYGMTYWARVKRAYGGAPHTGIDMVSASGNATVKAVVDGELFRGSIRCGGGQLKYVRVKHEDDGYSTYYLHVNY